MIRYRPGVNVLSMLSEAGYNTGVIRRDRVFGEKAVQKMREGKLPSWNELDKICTLTGCHPSDILEYKRDQ